MDADLTMVLQHKAINRWRLFWLIAIPMSIVMVVETFSVDLTVAPGVTAMIAFSVRWAVPFIFLVVATSALQVLFPGPFPAWLLRNRKYIGLCFAVAMAWQGLFIFLMSNFHREFYFDEIYLLRDELEGSTGYIFLAAMVVTSFQFGRKSLSPKQWKLLHTSGLYFLWAYPFSVYWFDLFYYDNPQPIDYVFYWSGFIAFALRIAAWGKKRQHAAKKIALEYNTPLVFRVSGAAIIVFGLLLSATGLQWQDLATQFVTGPAWSANLSLWLPFWPFEPFWSLFFIGAGTMLVTKTRTQVEQEGLRSPAT
ncbi:MAG: hypothetical protein O2805_01505 [Proteobacteria bacterium]|nr:hypothetical protein [Pseudomonadota bacterium]